MPLHLTAASSRVKKTKRATPLARRSPFATQSRSKPNVNSQSSKARGDNDGPEDTLPIQDGPLSDIGSSSYLSQSAPVEDVVQAIRHTRKTMFNDVPSRAGMKGNRIAEILNYRLSLPPLVSVAHVHALLDNPTAVEKEIVALIHAGRVRRLMIPGRGSDAAGFGDCLVLTEDWEQTVRESTALDESLKERFLEVLSRTKKTAAVPATFFSKEDSSALVQAGFLISSSAFSKTPLNIASLPTVTLFHGEGTANPGTGIGTTDATSSRPANRQAHFTNATMFLSLPNTGPYLRLLSAGRAHFMTVLGKSPYREAPVYLMRERWEGAVESNASYFLAKRARGESTGVLPGRTKKWKDLYGMSFQWILEEAVGAGLIELFDTGSVGPGARGL